LAKKSKAGKKTLFRAFYTQLMRHAFALGVSAGPGPATYTDGLRMADSPLAKSAIALAANEAAERNIEDTPKLAMGGIVTEPTYALIGEAGPEAVIPLSGPFMSPKPIKSRRKRSKYSKELGKQLKMLKKKHPRTNITALMKRAHRATRKALK
jgi:SLT domain-containing protein